MAGSSSNPYHSSDEPAKQMAMRLPFQKGEDVETKSFNKGYRGAWFVGKIMEIAKGSRKQLRYKLKYRDFEDERKVYQQRRRCNIETTELMVRPLPPDIVREEDHSEHSRGETRIVTYAWEVGDLVDWFYDKVWWEGIITVVDKEKVKISLWKPPRGEGGIHWAKPKHLRSSLVWSLSDSWSIPISKWKANGKPAAKIIELPSQGIPQARDVNAQLPGQAVGAIKRMRGHLAKVNEIEPKDDKNLNFKPVPLPKDTQLLVNRSNEKKRVEIKSDEKVSKLGQESVKPKRQISDLEVNSESKKEVDWEEVYREIDWKIYKKIDWEGIYKDVDWEEIYEGLQRRRIVFKRRMRKFMMYRELVNRAVAIRCKK